MEAKIVINNLDEFQALIERAKKEAEQLEKTVAQLREFSFDTDMTYANHTTFYKN